MSAGIADACAVLAGALGVSVVAVADAARIGEYHPWTSLGHLHVVVALEARLHR